jgi:hypothetical protein
MRRRDAMVTIDDLVANWIEMRATIKQQLEHFKSGNKMRVPGMDSEEATAEAVDRLEKCLAEIETLSVTTLPEIEPCPRDQEASRGCPIVRTETISQPPQLVR